MFLPEKTVVQFEFASHGNVSSGPVETEGNFCINFVDLSVGIIRSLPSLPRLGPPDRISPSMGRPGSQILRNMPV